MPAVFPNLLSFANIAVVLLTATLDRPQVANAINVHLYAESGCPVNNPGPVCTNLPELTCCKDHVGDIAYYYTSAYFEGLKETVTPISFAVAAWTWNIDSKCGKQSSVNQYDTECVETDRSYRDGYGAYWAYSRYGYNIPLPTARAFVNGSASFAALGDSLAQCKGSAAPDVYHIKLSAGSPPLPIARKVALKMMAAVTSIERNTDVLEIGEFVDRETGVVRGEKLMVIREILEKDGDGLTDEQIQALKRR